jgi:hypothetical protein
MRIVNVHQAKTHLSRLIDDAVLACPQTSFAGGQTDLTPDTSAFNSTKKPRMRRGL